MGEKKIEEITTYKINEVEIFSAGKWNNDSYELEDLHHLVHAFEDLKTGFRPYLKLGHNDKQTITKSSGLPSIGWVERVYVKGKKLYADFNNIPEKIFKLIKSKAYRKVSCEIYWDLDVNGTKYPRVLGAVALLGAENPGVMNLDDILGQYALNINSNAGVFEAMSKIDNVKEYSFNLETNAEDDDMSQELEKVQADLDAQKKAYDLAEQAKKDLETQLAEQSEKLKAFELEAAKSRDEAKAAKTAQFVTELESKKLVTPAMKDLISEMLSDKKEYAIGEKKFTREELISEILTLSKEAAKVNFDESSRADFGKKVDKDEELKEKVQKYMDENKCTYSAAAKAVMREIESKKSEE